ncbi:cupin domain-containing protein [Ekhidna sp.]|uniref:cupin domain-containing protein n=1 Tax=Ekhidna sp. TaxID=2608089 RepID=UPI003CCB9897
MPDRLFAYLEEIKGEPTAHLSGLKKVFLKNEDCPTTMTQFAYGIFKPDEICERHSHPTMEELFFFISGSGEYTVGETKVELRPGTFLRIPSATEHELINNGDTDLEFVYFGIALR